MLLYLLRMFIFVFSPPLFFFATYSKISILGFKVVAFSLFPLPLLLRFVYLHARQIFVTFATCYNFPFYLSDCFCTTNKSCIPGISSRIFAHNKFLTFLFLQQKLRLPLWSRQGFHVGGLWYRSWCEYKVRVFSPNRTTRKTFYCFFRHFFPRISAASVSKIVYFAF